MSPSVDEELKYWSLFEEPEVELERADFEHLALSSVTGQPKIKEQLPLIKADIVQGRKAAIAYMHRVSGMLHGLCVWGVQEPPSSELDTIVIHLFSVQEKSGESSISSQLQTATENKIMEGIIDFARSHGFQRIRAYMHIDNKALDLFTRHGFIVEHSDRAGQFNTYCLGREVWPCYNRDPYDSKAIIEWLCSLLSLEKCQEVINGFEAKCNFKIPSESGSERSYYTLMSWPVKIVAVRSSDVSKFSKAAKIPTLVLLDAVPAKLPQVHNMVFMPIPQLKQIIMNQRIDTIFWPPQADAADIEVEVRPSLFRNYKINRINAFIDSGQFGSVLKRGIEPGKKRYPHIFFINFDTARNDPTLLGVGQVKEIFVGSPNEIWTRYGKYSSFDEGDFHRYASIKKYMTAIEFDDLRVKEIPHVGLPIIRHSWLYFPSQDGFRVYRELAD